MMIKSLTYQNIIESLSTAIVVLDTSSRVILLNVATEVLFGMSQFQASDITFRTLLRSESKLFVSIRKVKETA